MSHIFSFSFLPRHKSAEKGVERIHDEYHQVIEEKYAALAFLNDDLKSREYENVALQAQRDVYQVQLQKCQDAIIHLKRRYVDHANDPGKDNIINRFNTTRVVCHGSTCHP